MYNLYPCTTIVTPPHHYIHHTFFTSDSTHYTTYATPFNLWPTPILPYLIYILLQFTTNKTLFTSDPTHNPTCTTPLPSLTPPLCYLQCTTFPPLIPHCHYLHHTHFNSESVHRFTYATPSSCVALPQYYLYHSFF